MTGSVGGSAQARANVLSEQGDASATAWRAGAEGERRVAAALDPLAGPSVVVLHDRLLNASRGKSNLDHIVVTSAGVFLCDAKMWVRAESVNGALFKFRKATRDCPARREPASAEADKVMAMAESMSRRLREPVAPVLVLAGDQADLFGGPKPVRGVLVIPVSRLDVWLPARPGSLTPRQVQALAAKADRLFPPATRDGREVAAGPGLIAAARRLFGR